VTVRWELCIEDSLSLAGRRREENIRKQASVPILLKTEANFFEFNLLGGQTNIDSELLSRDNIHVGWTWASPARPLAPWYATRGHQASIGKA
jgi:hypothetical protein